MALAMYKCYDNGEQREFIILDVEGDEDALSVLRRKSRSRELTCPQCHEAVQAKAGEVKAWHFAHLDLGTCPLQSESAPLLKARRILYEWLVRKFVERPGLPDGKKADVTVEKFLSPDLPKPVDCYVEQPDGTRLAYWVFDGGFRQRGVLKHALANCKLHPIFLQEMMRPVDGEDRTFDLSPTEREFLGNGDYNRLYGEDEQLWAFRQAFEDNVPMPAEGTVIGEVVSVTKIDYDGNPQQGLRVTCGKADGKTYGVALADVVFPQGSAAALHHTA